MKTEEWGWFVSEDLPYIEALPKRIRKKNIMIRQEMPVIIEEEKLLEKLDNQYDFGNIFATVIVNSLFICGICFCYKS
tara:strand:+ start:258 stop:491 length:234 start_codon:yes stop_codon:yes gene_type:complete